MSTNINQYNELYSQFIERKSEFEAVLPSNCPFDRFMRTVKTAIIQTPDLISADRHSLFTSSFKCAQDGLLPDGREAVLNVYNNKQKDGSYKKVVQYVPMVKGIIKKIQNSGELASLTVATVHENDQFDYQLGDNEYIVHKPVAINRGNLIYAYAIAKTHNNAIYREIMSREEIEQIRSISINKDGATWTKHFNEMAKKTVIRRLAKKLPMSSEVEHMVYENPAIGHSTHVTNSQTLAALENINNKVLDIAKSTNNIVPDAQINSTAHFTPTLTN